MPCRARRPGVPPGRRPPLRGGCMLPFFLRVRLRRPPDGKIPSLGMGLASNCAAEITAPFPWDARHIQPRPLEDWGPGVPEGIPRPAKPRVGAGLSLPRKFGPPGLKGRTYGLPRLPPGHSPRRPGLPDSRKAGHVADGENSSGPTFEINPIALMC